MGLNTTALGYLALLFIVIASVAIGLKLVYEPENRGIYTQSDSPKKSSRNIWSLAVVSVDQRY